MTVMTSAQAPRRPRSAFSVAGGRAALWACALVMLGGCGTVAPRPANDPATGTGAQSGESGVTVFGTIDMGAGAVRSSR